MEVARMRNWLSAFLLAVGVLIGYAISPRSVVAQGSMPFVAGEILSLHYEPDRGSTRCTVTMQHGDFLGCTTERAAGTIGQREVWYNLRFVTRVEKRER